MTFARRSAYIATAVILVVLIADQSLKFWVKTHMYHGQEIPVFGNWFYLHFVENNGMAFGLEFGGETGKLFLTAFRVLAIAFIGYFLLRHINRSSSPLLIASGSMIFAGALGNIIDSVFYGVIFNDSYNQIAEFLPSEGGYAPLFHGRVVDMLYFPLYSGFFPEWLPIIGGEPFIFFRPVFNIADAAITVGIAIIVIFQKRFFDVAGHAKNGSDALNASNRTPAESMNRGD
ncbi:MAG: lipoprotein signal peptidase [Salibacteraceae bacterium]